MSPRKSYFHDPGEIPPIPGNEYDCLQVISQKIVWPSQTSKSVKPASRKHRKYTDMDNLMQKPYSKHVENNYEAQVK